MRYSMRPTAGLQFASQWFADSLRREKVDVALFEFPLFISNAGNDEKIIVGRRRNHKDVESFSPLRCQRPQGPAYMTFTRWFANVLRDLRSSVSSRAESAGEEGRGIGT